MIERKKRKIIRLPSSKDFPEHKIQKLPSGEYLPVKRKQKQGKSHKQKQAIKKALPTGSGGCFYKSQEWFELRYRVLTRYSAKCMLCNATREDGVRIHVDHIKPISKFPERALDFTNLQILCEACNKGKSYKFDNDWRPT